MSYPGTVPYPKGTLCRLDNCDRPVKSKNLCHQHYSRLRLGKDINTPMRPKQYNSLQQAFEFHTVQTEHGLIWTGSTIRGYGRIGGGGRTSRWSKMAHRVAWELVNGPLDSKLELDHNPECPRNCVTVGHLTPRTKSEHAKIGWKRGQFKGNGWSEEAREKRTKTANCILCQKEYTADAKSKYCSKDCTIKAGNLKRKERRLGLESGTLCPTLEFDTFSRNKVYEEEQGICGICKERTDPQDWHLDHIIPRALGGEHIRSNVQVSHPACNLGKGSKII